jgi:hypothetical protein
VFDRRHQAGRERAFEQAAQEGEPGDDEERLGKGPARHLGPVGEDHHHRRDVPEQIEQRHAAADEEVGPVLHAELQRCAQLHTEEAKVPSHPP